MLFPDDWDDFSLAGAADLVASFAAAFTGSVFAAEEGVALAGASEGFRTPPGTPDAISSSHFWTALTSLSLAFDKMACDNDIDSICQGRDAAFTPSATWQRSGTRYVHKPMHAAHVSSDMAAGSSNY